MRDVWRRALDDRSRAVPRLTHAEAMRRYGSDKPDLRFGLELSDVAAAFARHAASSSSSTLAERRAVARSSRCAIPAARRSRAASSTRSPRPRSRSARSGLVVDRARRRRLRSRRSRSCSTTTTVAALRAETPAPSRATRSCSSSRDRAREASEIAGKLRLDVGDRLGLRDPAAFAFCWVVGFPLFERDPDSGEITFAHHPFTAPAPGQEDAVRHRSARDARAALRPGAQRLRAGQRLDP